MASQIQAVYTALTNMDVSIDSKVIKVKKPSELPNSIQTASLPIRLLTPIQQFVPGFMQSDSWNSSLGSGIVQVNWTITDIFLYDAVNQTIGIRALTDPLVDYCANYIEAMNDGSLVLPSSIQIKNYTARPDIINYPLGSNFWYYGAYVYHNILEKMQ